jgi:2-dehydro-3-deoxyphosphogluconate aldolase/(4S)-4-hydroxy-2-oxoglutarate aldolase
MDRLTLLNKIEQSGAVGIIRMADSKKLMKVTEAIYEGGITAIEITMTTPNALDVIEKIALEMGSTIQIGVGSVLDAVTARLAINAGAEFVVSPVFKDEIIKMAHRYDKAAMPGAFTPTEILTAFEAGADVIKVFPADILGMAFFKAVKAPMPQIKMMPTGGVNLDNAGEWLKAGACAVGIGSALLDTKAINEGNYKKLTENARHMCASIAAGRK